MADYSTAAHPYAKAVFELALDQGRLQEWAQQLAALAQVVRHPEVARLIGHPAVTRDNIVGLLLDAGRIEDESVHNLVRLLAQYGRLQVIPAIAARYEQLRAEAEKRVDVDITTAATVPAPQQQSLSEAIKHRLQRDVRVRWHTDEALIAGAQIRAGDLVIDGSVSGELDKLRHALVS